MITVAPKPTLIRTIADAVGLSIIRVLEAGKVIFLLAPFYLSLPQSVRAETVTTEEWVEYDDDAGTEAEVQPNQAAIARFGPFYVLGPNLVELNGAIDAESLTHFRRMVAAYPAIAHIRMIECPGTENDDANLAIARAIRKAGITTHVPAGGSVRSGGVELFLAGVKRTAEPGAEFGVHSWQDDEGNEAADVPANDPVHAAYVGYYQEMGFTPEQARAFYAFTNKTRFKQVHYMTGPELARFGVLN